MARIIFVVLIAAVLAPAQAPPTPEPLALNDRAVDFHRLGRFDEAIGLYRRALDVLKVRREPEDPRIVENLTRSLVAKAGRQLQSRDVDGALVTLHQARSRAPEDSIVLAYLGVAHHLRGLEGQAMDYLREAIRRDDKTSIAHEYMGFLAYRGERLADALKSWDRVLELDPSRAKALEPMMQKARRELAVEKTMRSEFSSHFVCRYGAETDRHTARQVLEDLEEAYHAVGRRLRCFPSRRLSVILYGDRDFARATGAHPWAAALFDGKIRLPVKNFRAQRRDVRASLFHEYTHYVVGTLSRHAPAWLNEGLAQLSEGRSPQKVKGLLGHAKRQDRLLSMDRLRLSFATLPDPAVARLAYAQGLSFTSWLEEKLGPGRVGEFLRAIGTDGNLEKAFRRVYRKPLAKAVEEWKATL